MADLKYADESNWEDKRTPIQFDDFAENSKAIFYTGQKIENGESNMHPLHDLSLSKFHQEVDSMMPLNNQMANSNHNFFSNSSQYNDNQINTSNIYMNNSNISLLNHGFSAHNMNPNIPLHHPAMQLSSANNNNQTNNHPSINNLNGPFLTNFKNVREHYKHLYPAVYTNNLAELPHLLSSQRENPLKRVIPLLCNLEEEPRYVNEKQFNRMMIMRIKRAKENTLKNMNQPEKSVPDKKKRYKYESRHQHAMKRVRGKDGRFVKTTEDEESRHDSISGEKKAKDKVRTMKKKISKSNNSSEPAKPLQNIEQVNPENCITVSKHEEIDVDESHLGKYQEYTKEDSNRDDDRQSLAGEPFDLTEDRPAELSNLMN